jgi:hypothetical protein
VAAGFGLATPQRAEAAAPRTVDPVIEWNRTLLQLIRTPGVQPATVHPTRNLAIMHLAIYDAVNAIERIGVPYAKGIAAGKHASAVAAADQAAHDTLVALYPTRQADLDSELRDDLTKIRNTRTAPSVRSEALPGVQRSFTSFSGAAQEAALSRIYAGQHTRVDHVAGVELGRNVAHYVLHHDLQLR